MEFTVHVYHHFESAGRDAVLEDLLTRVTQLQQQGVFLMTAAETMKAKLDEIDTATNNIAADLQGLKNQIGTGMSAEDVAAVQARLDVTATALTAIAADTPDV